MKIFTAIVTYRRSWALKYSLSSLCIQTRQPDEVIIILKPSGDSNKEVVNEFRGKLPINLIVQESGNFVDAVDMTIRSKKVIWNKKILAYCAKKRGYDTYTVSEVSTAPVAWHIVHENSLTRGRGFWHEFW
ncbi:MAG: hypothetical protein ACP5IE_08470, partial [Infirmifilum sp.]